MSHIVRSLMFFCIKVFLIGFMFVMSLSVYSQAAYMDEVADEARDSGMDGFSGVVAVLIIFGVLYYVERYIEERKERKEREEKRQQKMNQKKEYAKGRADSELIGKRISDYQENQRWKMGFDKATYDYLYGSPKTISDAELSSLILQHTYQVGDFFLDQIGYYQGLNYYLRPKESSEPVLSKEEHADKEVEVKGDSEVEEEAGVEDVEYKYDGTQLAQAWNIKGHFVVPDGVKTLGVQSFIGCREMTSIDLPDSLENIFPRSFLFCDGLTEVCIPNKVKKIYQATFCRCENLTRIKIPASVNEIETFAIYDCPNLKHIEVDPNNETFVSENGLLITRQGELIYAAEGLEEVVIPPYVNRIDCVAFDYSYKLKSVVMPLSLDESALKGLKSIERIEKI